MIWLLFPNKVEYHKQSTGLPYLIDPLTVLFMLYNLFDIHRRFVARESRLQTSSTDLDLPPSFSAAETRPSSTGVADVAALRREVVYNAVQRRLNAYQQS